MVFFFYLGWGCAGCSNIYTTDNAPVHNSKMVQNFLKESHVSTMQWPAKSPDMNIAEDV